MDNLLTAVIGATLGCYIGQHYWGRNGFVAGGLVGGVVGRELPKFFATPTAVLTELPQQPATSPPSQPAGPIVGGLTVMPTTSQPVGHTDQDARQRRQWMQEVVRQWSILPAASRQAWVKQHPLARSPAPRDDEAEHAFAWYCAQAANRGRGYCDMTLR